MRPTDAGTDVGTDAGTDVGTDATSLKTRFRRHCLYLLSGEAKGTSSRVNSILSDVEILQKSKGENHENHRDHPQDHRDHREHHASCTCTMVENSQEYRLEYWATRSSIRSFARTAHSFRTAHFARALRCAHSFARSLTSLTPSLVGR